MLPVALELAANTNTHFSAAARSPTSIVITLHTEHASHRTVLHTRAPLERCLLPSAHCNDDVAASRRRLALLLTRTEYIGHHRRLQCNIVTSSYYDGTDDGRDKVGEGHACVCVCVNAAHRVRHRHISRYTTRRRAARCRVLLLSVTFSFLRCLIIVWRDTRQTTPFVFITW